MIDDDLGASSIGSHRAVSRCALCVCCVLALLSGSTSGQVVVRMPNKEILVQELIIIQEHLFIKSAGGVYLSDGVVTKQIIAPEVHIDKIVEVNGRIWLTSHTGAYR